MCSNTYGRIGSLAILEGCSEDKRQQIYETLKYIPEVVVEMDKVGDSSWDRMRKEDDYYSY